MNAIQFSNQQRTPLVQRPQSDEPENIPPSAASAIETPSSTKDLPGETLSEEHVQRIAKAIADPQRFAILSCIAQQAELPCKTLVATFSIKQATISHHLKELAAAQLIESRKQGQRAILSCRRDVCDAYVRALESRFVSAIAQ